ncbi:coiled-coil domain-containing protein 63 [Dendroctonus ponderosae]|uniref:coiled-coil domain-containing protein 63 n=1 Tax=Dendroctonus ponderosae TaxID=77166 RepID=UPI002035439F|nr:coiled-coil domain-containing protein 63 [Dendroctonus ponderosae]XP_048521635.1 coiled-coil domain-containing protein 63 [Dendroctonus ponderosae]
MNQVTRPAPNASTEKEMVSMAEEELARLRRQLRIMEDDRMAFSDETTLKLEKQRKIIQQLRQEREKLCEDINAASCKTQQRKDKKLSKDICKLLDVYEEYCRKVRTEQDGILEMDAQIKKLETDIKHLRPKTAVTEYHFQTRLTSGQKAVQILKNRLDNTIKKFCAILATNKELREEINHLLKERNHFNEVWEKLLKDINVGKKYMIDLIEQAIMAFDQREEWCSKLDALKKRADVDLILHSEEMREIQRRLDHYIALREFLCVKGQKRILKDLEEKERMKKEMQEKELEDQLEMYENTLKQIQEFCNEENVERIAALFLKQEEENFALFNYVNELTHEIESLNNIKEQVREKIEEQIELTNQRANERQATLSSLQQDLENASAEANEEEKQLNQAQANLKIVLSGIEEVFEMVDCDRGPILKLLGENSEINLFNVKIYMDTVEKKLSGIVTEMYFAEKSMISLEKKAI